MVEFYLRLVDWLDKDVYSLVCPAWFALTKDIHVGEGTVSFEGDPRLADVCGPLLVALSLGLPPGKVCFLRSFGPFIRALYRRVPEDKKEPLSVETGEKLRRKFWPENKGRTVPKFPVLNEFDWI